MTVASVESKWPSVALNENESVPVKPALGVYVTLRFSWSIAPSVPLAGGVSIEIVSGFRLTSVQFSETWTAAPTGVVVDPPLQTGGAAPGGAPGPA